MAGWQQAIVDAEPEAFIRGLMDSDGCRITATYHEPRGVVRRYGRYIFSNRSVDIHTILSGSLDQLGVRWTRTRWETVVARQADVRKLDHFVGAKD